MTFTLDKEDCTRADEWLKEHSKGCNQCHVELYGTNIDGSDGYNGAIGGCFTYCFTPTSIGTVITLKCSCGARQYIGGEL